jgi:hypothetical protein
VSSNYRFAAPFIVRMLGIGLVAVGVLVLVWAGLAVALSLPGAVLSTGLLVAVVLWLLVLGSVVALRRGDVVRLDETGYRVRFVRGAGVRQAPWKDVEDVTAPTVEGQRCVLLRLRDGRTTTVPVDVLAGSSDAFVKDLQQHLNRGHGYRRVPPSAAS